MNIERYKVIDLIEVLDDKSVRFQTTLQEFSEGVLVSESKEFTTIQPNQDISSFDKHVCAVCEGAWAK